MTLCNFLMVNLLTIKNDEPNMSDRSTSVVWEGVYAAETGSKALECAGEEPAPFHRPDLPAWRVDRPEEGRADLALSPALPHRAGREPFRYGHDLPQQDSGARSGERRGEALQGRDLPPLPRRLRARHRAVLEGDPPDLRPAAGRRPRQGSRPHGGDHGDALVAARGRARGRNRAPAPSRHARRSGGTLRVPFWRDWRSRGQWRGFRPERHSGERSLRSRPDRHHRMTSARRRG